MGAHRVGPREGLDRLASTVEPPEERLLLRLSRSEGGDKLLVPLG